MSKSNCSNCLCMTDTNSRTQVSIGRSQVEVLVVTFSALFMSTASFSLSVFLLPLIVRFGFCVNTPQPGSFVLGSRNKYTAIF